MMDIGTLLNKARKVKCSALSIEVIITKKKHRLSKYLVHQNGFSLQQQKKIHVMHANYLLNG